MVAYTPPYAGGFTDLPAKTTPIVAAALNTMSDGIAANAAGLALKADANNVTSRAAGLYAAKHQPGIRRRVMARPPKIELASASTITGAVFYGITAGGVVLDRSARVFDFGVREGQVDTVRNVFTASGYANAYPYNAAVLPSLALGAPNGVYYASGYFQPRTATDAQVVELIMLYGLSQSDVMIYVDGQPVGSVAPFPSAPGSGNSVVRLTFDTKKPRTIEMSGGAHLIGCNVGPNDRAWLPATPVAGPHLAILGDSVGQGTGASSPQFGFAYQLADHLGWDKYSIFCQGGTGYFNPGAAGFAKFGDRVANVIANHPDVVVVEGGYNDDGTLYPPATWAAGVLGVFQALRAGLPNAVLICVGPWGQSRLTAAQALYYARFQALKTIFAANPGVCDRLVDTVSTPTYWFTGTGYQGATTGDGNSDLYIYTDSIHFSQAGHDYVAWRLAQEIAIACGYTLPTRAITNPTDPWGDTATNVAAATVPPAVGQLVVETDTNKVRLGDGTTAAGSLPELVPQRWRSRVSPNGPQVAVSGGTPISLLYYGPGTIGSYVNGASGCYVTYRGEIGPGTWTARVWYMKSTNLGQVKMEYSLNEGTSWATAQASVDMYAAAATYLQSIDTTGIVVPKGCATILFRWTSIGKNASSSAYYPFAGEVDLTRTA